MERETKTITTPKMAVPVVLYTYITGREAEAIQDPLFKAMTIKPGHAGKEVQVGDLDTTKVRESNHLALKFVVKSVSGNAENVVDTLLDMPAEDYNFVVEAVEEITKKK